MACLEIGIQASEIRLHLDVFLVSGNFQNVILVPFVEIQVGVSLLSIGVLLPVVGDVVEISWRSLVTIEHAEHIIVVV